MVDKTGDLVGAYATVTTEASAARLIEIHTHLTHWYRTSSSSRTNVRINVSNKAIRIFTTPSNLAKERKNSTKRRVSVISSIIDMSWYDAWLSQQLKDIPYCIRELRVGSNSLLTKSCLDRLFTAIECVAQEIEGVFIDEIVARLQEIGILDSADKFLDAQKLLIFAVLGWQSMLYQAAFNVCSVRELAIHQDSDQPIQSPFVSANESVRQPPASSTIHNREICD